MFSADGLVFVFFTLLVACGAPEGHRRLFGCGQNIVFRLSTRNNGDEIRMKVLKESPNEN